MPYHEHQIADKAGSGSRSRIEDKKTDVWQSKDKRSETKTTFHKNDIDNNVQSQRQRKQFRRMLRWQEGERVTAGGEKSRGQQNHDEWQRRVAETYSSQLSLTDAQQERVLHLVTDVLDINSFGYYSVEEIVLGVINTVTREDGWNIEDEPQFHEYMVEVGLSKKAPDWTDDDRRADIDALSRLRELVCERVPSM